MSKWTYIKKGDRRPEGRVLVAYVDDGERKFLKAVFGENMPREDVTIAHWNKSKSAWLTDHFYVNGVYAWMPLPNPPAGEQSDIFPDPSRTLGINDPRPRRQGGR